MGEYGRPDVLRELLKDTRRWLRQYEPLALAMARLCQFIRVEPWQSPERTVPAEELLQELERLNRRMFATPSHLFEFSEQLVKYDLPSEVDRGLIERSSRRERADPQGLGPLTLESVQERLALIQTMVYYARELRRTVMDKLDALPTQPFTAKDRRPLTGEPKSESADQGDTGEAGETEGAGKSTRTEPSRGDDPGAGRDPDPADGVSRSTPAGRFGLVLNDTTRTVRRSGVDAEVDLSRSLLSWGLLEAFLKARTPYLAERDLFPVWEYHGRKDRPRPQTVIAAVSTLKKHLRPLGLTIGHRTGLGYALEGIPSAPRPLSSTHLSTRA